MKNVIVLTDKNKNEITPYLDNFRTCINKNISKTIFKYSIFELSTNIDTNISKSDAIFIILNNKLNNKMFSKINEMINENQNKIILCGFEKDDDEYNYNKLRPIINNSLIKCFDIEYENVQAKQWFINLLINGHKISPILPEKYESHILNTNDLIILFEKHKLSHEFWDHYSRLRIIDYSIKKYGYHKTVEQLGWLCMNWKNNYEWNYTIIRFWATIINNINEKYYYSNFEELYKKNAEIHRETLINDYYSNDILLSSETKEKWIRPDLKDLVISYTREIVI